MSPIKLDLSQTGGPFKSSNTDNEANSSTESLPSNSTP